jgi:hypothetical protein
MNPSAETLPPAAPPPAGGKVMEHVIPTRNQPALMGYYYAIFGLIPLAGLFLAPAAISYGLIGLDRGNRLPRNIGYGHALFATVAGIIGAILNYGMIAALAVTLLFSYLHATWPFLPDETLQEVIQSQQQQINELQQQLESIRRVPAVPGRNVH